MKVLFIFCEGPHDAHFIGRLLKESGQYHDFMEPLKQYPKPLDSFISKKYQNRNIEEIRIGKPDNPLVPVCGLKKNEDSFLVLPISFGGMDKTDEAKNLFKEIQNSFAPDILDMTNYDVKVVSNLFIYDADARGLSNTVNLWNERFSDCISTAAPLPVNAWTLEGNQRVALFVFTGADGDTGTLEDNLIDLFRSNDERLLEAAEIFLSPQFETISQNGDELAHETKKKKGILTICGQAEKKNAGYALTVVVRDTKLLDGVFDFSVQNAQWTKLLNLINGAFE